MSFCSVPCGKLADDLPISAITRPLESSTTRSALVSIMLKLVASMPAAIHHAPSDCETHFGLEFIIVSSALTGFDERDELSDSTCRNGNCETWSMVGMRSAELKPPPMAADVTLN